MKTAKFLLWLFLILLQPLNLSAVESKHNYPNYGDQKSAALEDLLYIFGHLVPKYYYRPIPDMDECIYQVLNKGLEGCLDKNSIYFSRSRLTPIQDDTEYGGIGVTITEKNGEIKIKAVQKNTPAHTAGILRGDVVVEVSDKQGVMRPTEGKKAREVANVISGPMGRTVKIVVMRNGSRMSFEMRLALIPIIWVESRLLHRNIAYIKLESFSHKGIAAKFRAHLLEIASNKKTSLVVDLRDNPGGFLDETLKILTLFENDPQSTLLTERKYENGAYVDYPKKLADVLYDYTGFLPTYGKFSNRKIVVLINGESASSSEIVAGYLQQNGATVIGEQSYKKGTVQSDIRGLKSGGVIYLTTAEYLIGNSKTRVDGIGVAPDITIANPDSWNPGDVEDQQLQKAVEILNK